MRTIKRRDVQGQEKPGGGLLQKPILISIFIYKNIATDRQPHPTTDHGSTQNLDDSNGLIWFGLVCDSRLGGAHARIQQRWFSGPPFYPPALLFSDISYTRTLRSGKWDQKLAARGCTGWLPTWQADFLAMKKSR
jgi:hypothetical protein